MVSDIGDVEWIACHPSYLSALALWFSRTLFCRLVLYGIVTMLTDRSQSEKETTPNVNREISISWSLVVRSSWMAIHATRT